MSVYSSYIEAYSLCVDDNRKVSAYNFSRHCKLHPFKQIQGSNYNRQLTYHIHISILEGNYVQFIIVSLIVNLVIYVHSSLFILSTLKLAVLFISNPIAKVCNYS